MISFRGLIKSGLAVSYEKVNSASFKSISSADDQSQRFSVLLFLLIVSEHTHQDNAERVVRAIYWACLLELVPGLNLTRQG